MQHAHDLAKLSPSIENFASVSRRVLHAVPDGSHPPDKLTLAIEEGPATLNVTSRVHEMHPVPCLACTQLGSIVSHV